MELYTSRFGNMRITEIARKLGVLTDEIRWFERKGYVQPTWLTLGTRNVRDYSQEEVHKIELLVKYRRQGYEYETANQKALEELQNPQLI